MLSQIMLSRLHAAPHGLRCPLCSAPLAEPLYGRSPIAQMRCAWYILAEKFERLDRPFRLSYTLEKLARLESIRAGKQPPILLNECDL
jgi:hypothetical protein